MLSERVNILIGTPAYNSQVSTDYLHSIIDFNKSNIPFSVMTIGNESLITRGRNTIISHFFHSREFTHLLFLDADIYLTARDLIKLIGHSAPIIGAPVALKGYSEGRTVPNIGKVYNWHDSLASVECIGTAVLLLERKLVEEFLGTCSKYSSNPLSRGVSLKECMYDAFQVGVVESNYLSEDFYFCHRLRKMGFSILVDMSIKTRHSGNFTFSLGDLNGLS